MTTKRRVDTGFFAGGLGERRTRRGSARAAREADILAHGDPAFTGMKEAAN
jgi:hypothetical protein